MKSLIQKPPRPGREGYEGRGTVTAFGREFPKFSRDEIHQRIVEVMKRHPPGRVLDLPAGSGRLSWWLQNEGFEVVAADISPEQFCNPEIPVHRADLNERFPFADDAFDCACFIEGPEHVENVYGAMREFARVIRPGGRLITSIPNYSNLEARLKQLFFGTSEKVVSGEKLRAGMNGITYMTHINRLPYPMLRMAMEFARFRIEDIDLTRRKPKQMLLWPLAALIMGASAVRGESGRRDYWLDETNSAPVLMGGNTLIITAIVL